MAKVNWTEIKSEYICGNISYRKLAEKHNISFNTLQERAVKEGWFKARKKQREKIAEKTIQKASDKIATIEARRIAKINDAADKLLRAIEKATEQLNLYVEKERTEYEKDIIDSETGEVREAVIKKDRTVETKLERIDRAGLKQLTSALRDIKDIQYVRDDWIGGDETEF